MPKPLSAIEAVTPAIEQTKQQLFKPFRFWHWARLALVVVVTWDFSGGGGGNFNIPFPDDKRKEDFALFAAPDFKLEKVMEYLPWIILGVGILLALVLVFMFIASVFRFVLFESVLRNKCEIRAGWKRWQEQGYSYFLWALCLGFSVLLAMSLLIGGPVLIAWSQGVFDSPKEHIGLLILGGIALFILLMVFFIGGAVIAVLAKDFAIPIMALERVGIVAAWRRLLIMMAGEKLAYAGYVGMKIVLAIASGILFGIINLVAILVLMIPLAIAGVVIYAAGKGMGLEWNLLTITITVLLGAVAFHLLLAVMAFVSVPPMVFFQSYVLHFLGSRYPMLGEKVFPPPPAKPIPLEPGPEPAPAM